MVIVGSVAGFLLYLTIVILNFNMIIKSDKLAIIVIAFGCGLVFAGSYIGHKFAT